MKKLLFVIKRALGLDFDVRKDTEINGLIILKDFASYGKQYLENYNIVSDKMSEEDKEEFYQINKILKTEIIRLHKCMKEEYSEMALLKMLIDATDNNSICVTSVRRCTEILNKYNPESEV